MQRQSFLPLLKDYYQHVLTHALNPNTPLLADGLDTLTDKPVYWTYPDATTAIMSNFASQQNFLRGLCGMTQVTGDEKWQQTAEQVTHYFLDNYCDSASGLFNWGGHRFINQQTGEIEGPASKERVHELKHHFPFYDFLHQVDAKKTEDFLHGFWASHVLDWQKLDLSRHGQYGQKPIDNVFSHYQPEPVVDPNKWPELPETVGLTFVNAATDLIYAACHYSQYTDDQHAATWAKHLYQQFVLARNPKTGMPVYQFSSPKQREPIPEDDKLTYSWFGDRAKRQFGPEFGEVAREANALFRDCWPVVVDNPLAILLCAKKLNDPELAAGAIAGIKAYFAHAWDTFDNQMIPMWNNGDDLTGYTFKRDGYYGEKGTELKRQPADPAYLLPLIRACVMSDDFELRQLMATMFARFELGLINPETLVVSEINPLTEIASPYLVFALLDLHQLTQQESVLTLSDCIANNIVQAHYHRGYFVESSLHRFARIDDPAPYALLALEAAYKGDYDQLAVQISTGGYLHGERDINGEIKTVYDRDVIYDALIEEA